MVTLVGIPEDPEVVDPHQLVTRVDDEGHSREGDDHHQTHPVDLLFQGEEEVGERDQPRNDKVLLELGQGESDAVPVQQEVENKPDGLEGQQEESD